MYTIALQETRNFNSERGRDDSLIKNLSSEPEMFDYQQIDKYSIHII
jgi:hypothetical protein